MGECKFQGNKEIISHSQNILNCIFRLYEDRELVLQVVY